VELPIALPAPDGSLQEHGGVGEVAIPDFERTGKVDRADFQLFIPPRPAAGRDRQWRRIRFRCPQPPQSRPRRALQALTGKDAPVIDYLNQQESVHQFLASAMSLVDASVSAYQRRGFKHLMVSFGCTGGQHRSVYLAEQLAKHLRGQRSGGVEVVVRHREQEQWNQ
jgi:hypothetical protein